MSPGRVHIDDLPAKRRRQIAADADEVRSTRSAVRTATATSESRTRWRCATCGAIGDDVDAWTYGDRHCDETGHLRLVTIENGEPV